jgi:hypothetical protein
LNGCQELEEQLTPILIGHRSTSLENHKKTIEKAVSQLKSSGKFDDRKLQKYLWLIKYHNAAVNEVPKPVKFPSFLTNAYDADVFSGIDPEKLRISENIIDSSRGTT